MFAVESDQRTMHMYRELYRRDVHERSPESV